MSPASSGARAVVLGAGILGFAMAGLVDGILFHHVLQWHQLISARATRSAAAVRADGLFHLVLWLALAGGFGLLWRARGALLESWSPRRVGGALLLGAGLFHFVDTVVNHVLLRTHHIHPAEPLLSDVLFFLVGCLFAAGGWRLLQSPSTVAAAASAGQRPT